MSQASQAASELPWTLHLHRRLRHNACFFPSPNYVCTAPGIPGVSVCLLLIFRAGHQKPQCFVSRPIHFSVRHHWSLHSAAILPISVGSGSGSSRKALTNHRDSQTGQKTIVPFIFVSTPQLPIFYFFYFFGGGGGGWGVGGWGGGGASSCVWVFHRSR